LPKATAATFGPSAGNKATGRHRRARRRRPRGHDATRAQLRCERIEANRDDPGFKLTISAPTNADAREIGTAIRAERQRIGELGKDVRVLDATGRTGDTYKLPLPVGDRVRLFDRVFDARVAAASRSSQKMAMS